MQPQRGPAIERATRREYPNGIAAHGTDALRFTFAALAAPSRDIRFDLGRVGGYRNFCNKLWNAARFVTQRISAAEASETDPHGGGSAPQDLQFSVADRWIRSRFGRTLQEVETAFTDYRFDFVAMALYKFTYDDFCDWYIELTKPVLEADAAAPSRVAKLRWARLSTAAGNSWVTKL